MTGLWYWSEPRISFKAPAATQRSASARSGHLNNGRCSLPSTSPRRSDFVCNAQRRRRSLIQSDGQEHLGSALDRSNPRDFPGPKGNRGPPIRVLPIGGLGEIGMNCMLVGIYDRYIMIDAGLMFPDFTDIGMQKILPDTSFIAQWKDKIEALVITHGHEDHIGAIPWVLPALDPSTPVYCSAFVSHLLHFRLKQFNLWDQDRFHVFEMNTPFQLGPFECEALRVTHSIPDCCGLILRNSHGTILHTGDWKIDENPVDGRMFDRETLEKLSKENVTLMMSDSTNVLTPGRSLSESVVRQSLIDKICDYKGDGRVIATLFASNLHRIGSLKMAADAAGRKLCFVGWSLDSYLASAIKSGDAPFDQRELIDSSELDDIDPNKVLIVTTGSQAEPQAALSLASRNASARLNLLPDDLIVYSAKIVPGNEKRVMKMMNRISRLGPRIEMRRTDNLHASGHGYREELAEVIQLVKPQQFLPVHGESVFLHAHAELAHELGIQRTSVIHDGEMLGVKSLRSRRTVSSGAMQVLGNVDLVRYYNDGNKGTGTYTEMDIYHRLKIGTDGIIIVLVDLERPPRVAEMIRSGSEGEMQTGLKARIKLTTRGIWTDRGRIVRELYKLSLFTVADCPIDISCINVERRMTMALRKACRKFNKINPEVIIVVHEDDPRIAAAMVAAKIRVTETDETEGRVRNKAVFSKKSETRDRDTPTAEERESETDVAEMEPSPEEEESAINSETLSMIEDFLVESPNGVDDDTLSIESGLDREEKQPSDSNAVLDEDKKYRRRTSSSSKTTTTTRKRRGRPPKKKPESEEFPSLSDLILAPESLLQERRMNNPRERPVPGADVEYG